MHVYTYTSITEQRLPDVDFLGVNSECVAVCCSVLQCVAVCGMNSDLRGTYLNAFLPTYIHTYKRDLPEYIHVHTLTYMYTCIYTNTH